jgi:hypothetical protein
VPIASIASVAAVLEHFARVASMTVLPEILFFDDDHRRAQWWKQAVKFRTVKER